MIRLRLLTAAALTGLVVTTAGCAHPPPAAAPAGPPPASSESDTDPDYKDVSVVFGQDEAATTYDRQLVPDGARLFVAELVHDDHTTIVLDAHGLLPNRQYGAHAHTKPCGAKPEDAGPHFQHTADPVQPSVNPAFANPDNEIWLDFVTDGKGNASRAATVDWTFGPVPANSVVIHSEGPTKTMTGQAGMAGSRAACVSVRF